MKANRNDLCPCGSGKKYKKCHLEEDESRERGKRNLATLQQWVAFHCGGLAASVRERARREPAVQAAMTSLHEGTQVADPLADEQALQVALFDVVVGEQPLITQGTTEDLAAQYQQSLRTGLARTYLSLYEVMEVKRGKGVRLRDRLLERDRWFSDPELALKLEPMEVVVGRILAFDKRNVLLEGWEKVGFRGRKAAIADLAASLAREVMPPDTTFLKAAPATQAVASKVSDSEDESDEGLDAAPGEEEAEVDETRPAVGEASPEIQAARVRWLKAHAVEVVRRVRAAAPLPAS